MTESSSCGFSRKRQNIAIDKKQKQLIEEFGGRCEKCGTTEKLQFAHKIGHRIGYGPSRGKNARILEVSKYGKDRFHLFCVKDHREYDKNNPLTEEEIASWKKREDEKVPF